MGRHVVVEDLEGAGGLLPPPQPFERRGLRHQRLPPQREATIGDGRIQMGQRLLPFPGPRQPPPQVEPQPVPLPVLRELIEHPPQQRDPIPPPHPRQAPPQQMQRIRRQLTVRQLGAVSRSSASVHRPRRSASAPSRYEAAARARADSAASSAIASKRLLPIRPRLDGGGSRTAASPSGSSSSDSHGIPENSSGVSLAPERRRQKEDEGPMAAHTAWNAGLQTGTRRAPPDPTQPHAAHLPERRHAGMAPPAWNAGFSRHSPPPAGGVAYACSPRSRAAETTNPQIGGTAPRRGTPASRRAALGPPVFRPARGPQARKARLAPPPMAPPAWNAGFSRHSPPPAGGVTYASSPRPRERTNHQPSDRRDSAPGLERRSPDRHARRSAPRTS